MTPKKREELRQKILASPLLTNENQKVPGASLKEKILNSPVMDAMQQKTPEDTK
jgi:hypothetical protein